MKLYKHTFEIKHDNGVKRLSIIDRDNNTSKARQRLSNIEGAPLRALSHVASYLELDTDSNIFSNIDEVLEDMEKQEINIPTEPLSSSFTEQKPNLRIMKKWTQTAFKDDYYPNLNLLDGFIDSSWGNDACPSMMNHDTNIRIFIAENNPLLREYNSSTQFVIVDTEFDVDLLESDSWKEVMDWINNYANKKVPKNTVSDFPISRGSWDFIERYYKNYFHCNDILRSSDLEKILTGEEEPNSVAREVLMNEFNGDRNDPALQLEYETLHHSIYAKASKDFINKKKAPVT